MTDVSELRALIGKRLCITKPSGATYLGTLLSVQEKNGRFCVGHLTIINMHGGATSTTERRWFPLSCSVQQESKYEELKGG